jgi:hypothetical protein
MHVIACARNTGPLPRAEPAINSGAEDKPARIVADPSEMANAKNVTRRTSRIEDTTLLAVLPPTTHAQRSLFHSQ